MKNLSRLALVVLACTGLLSGCGGGGGGGATTPTTPPPVDTPEPPTTLAGNIWHSFSDLGNPDGTFVLNPNTGVSTTVQAQKWGRPWPDGSRFVNNDYDSQGSSGESRLTVRKTDDKAVVFDQVVDGYVTGIAPSPQSGSQVLAYWGENTTASRSAVVWDFGTQKVLYATPPSRTPDAVGWMPDGSLLRAQPSGSLSKVVVGGAEQPVATVSWPESRLPQAVYVSPDGSKVLVQLAALRSTGSVSGVDLWMMDANGSNLKRFTNNGVIADAYWSPDSKFVAFTKDTGVVCTDTTCQGECSVWYAPATATDVVGVEGGTVARKFPAKRPDGSATDLRCPVLAWTR
ncbi:hypothetical protein J2X20_003605 [Pelomonas saccharophila]|uniref:Uncharacterized protein n=1 Tax=Roseateles saccharophilus TaxID=304 RepID=A0ABU1YQ07_ROSSA|nr:hypothetical protein [Roseateles saccharophilus]MDR7270947.1 hypothetical protein [Roseateles saccharophilus]